MISEFAIEVREEIKWDPFWQARDPTISLWHYLRPPLPGR
jgi:hypothetical protein